MGSCSSSTMLQFLTKSLSSLNKNKLNGLLAEIDFRLHLKKLGFEDRVSVGGWMARSTDGNQFGESIVAFFPETIKPDEDYQEDRPFNIPTGLHTICSTFHQIGIKSYFCKPTINIDEDYNSIDWQAMQLGLPAEQNPVNFPQALEGFAIRQRNYNFLRYNTLGSSEIPATQLPEEFTKEHIRVCFQNHLMAEVTDLDGIYWGQNLTYPLEIKEKTPAVDTKFGEWFGLDAGPFIKLSFFSSKRQNFNSIFVVREIDSVEDRNLVNWWYITFDRLARYASWNIQGGGQNMGGGRSTVVRIPKSKFQLLDKNALQSL
jgi:hypothetical protein